MKRVKTIGCEEALSHLLEYLDQEVGATTRHQVEHHLDACRSCFSRAEFERHLRDKLRSTGRQPAGESFRERIKTLVKRF
ncbi:MAG: zf-HC2 domain-containing protein [Nitrospirota bacterium]